MIKTRKWLVVPVVLLLIGALFSSTIIVSADPATAVTVQPATKKVGIGDTFTVDIYVTPDVAIAGVQLDLSFTASILKANNLTGGNLFGGSTFFWPGAINNAAGTIVGVAGVSIGGSTSSPGTFATVSFNATAAGTSPVTLSNVKVANAALQWVGTAPASGSVTVYADWDVNMDDHVDALDMVSVGNHWGQTGAFHWIREDAFRDGVIDVLDMVLIGQHWTG